MNERKLDTTHLNLATVVATAARPEKKQGSPVNPPIILSSTYTHMGAPDGAMLYARWTNESWHPAEELIATLENAQLPALVHASGMAAVANAMHCGRPGAPIVVPRHAYHATLLHAHDRAGREGGHVREVDIADTEAVIAALHSFRKDNATNEHIREGEVFSEEKCNEAAGILWIESPTNPMLEIADISTLTEAAHRVGALVIVDNTFATPLAQRPLDLGADVVLHSATKYLSGHSDVVLGALATNDPTLHATLQEERTNTGGIAGPMEAWLLLRGMRTLALRMERIWDNANELARRFASHPLIERVSHPSLTSHPQHERASQLMDGFGGVLTIEPKGGVQVAERLGEFTHIWIPATSLGGVESSFERRRRFSTEAPSVPESLIRMSVGIENIDDLWRDIDHALRASYEKYGKL